MNVGQLKRALEFYPDSHGVRIACRCGLYSACSQVDFVGGSVDLSENETHSWLGHIRFDPTSQKDSGT